MNRLATLFSFRLAVLACLLSATGFRAQADTIYVANHNNTIVKIDSSGNASVFASSGLNQPTGMAFDSSGNLFVANYGDGTIEKFDPSGNGTVFAPLFPMPFWPVMYPFSLAFDGSGNLYAVDRGNDRILKFDPQGHASELVDYSSLLSDGLGMAIDASSNLYVARYNHNAVVKFDTNGVGSVFANPVYVAPPLPPPHAPVSPPNYPTSLAFDSSGNLYAGNHGTGVIIKFDANGKGSLFNAIPTTIDIDGLAIDSSGNLYASSYIDNVLVKYDPSGHGTIIADASDGLDGPWFIAVQIPEPSSLLLATAGALLLYPLLKRKRA